MTMNADVSGIPWLDLTCNTKCCIWVCWLECFCKGSLAYLIFVIFFTTGTIFLHAKVPKSRQNRFRDISIFPTSVMWRNLNFLHFGSPNFEMVGLTCVGFQMLIKLCFNVVFLSQNLRELPLSDGAIRKSWIFGASGNFYSSCATHDENWVQWILII